MQNEAKPTKETHNEHCDCGHDCHLPSKDLLPMIVLPGYTRQEKQFRGAVTTMIQKSAKSDFIICRFAFTLLNKEEFQAYLVSGIRTSIPFAEGLRITFHQRKSIDLRPFFPSSKVNEVIFEDFLEAEDGTLFSLKTGKPAEVVKDERVSAAYMEGSILERLQFGFIPGAEWKFGDAGDYMYIVTDNAIHILYHKDTKPDFGVLIPDTNEVNMFLHDGST